MYMAPLSLPSCSKPWAGKAKEPPLFLLRVSRQVQARLSAGRAASLSSVSLGETLEQTPEAQGPGRPTPAAQLLQRRSKERKRPRPYFFSHLWESQVMTSNFGFTFEPRRAFLLSGELTHLRGWPHTHTSCLHTPSASVCLDSPEMVAVKSAQLASPLRNQEEKKVQRSRNSD